MSLLVQPAEVVAITGPSGSGKTTLLNIIAGLDRPTVGTVTVLGAQLSHLTEGQLTAFRGRALGLVFQDPQLLPGLTALENVVVARLPWTSRRVLEEEARALFAAIGLENRRDFPPGKLSGGERQRVGIARALIGRPQLLLADEPTGNLDMRSTEDLLLLLDRLYRELRFTLILATHDPAVAAVADRVLQVVGGRIQRERPARRDPALEVRSLE
ncbi:MAG: ABC transporter ATP-binding protein [Candidatus Dormibacteraeota bacterium]|nr:ABC transporter ATP-binding protein [Candidatus Dormibacteraeota bacterium]